MPGYICFWINPRKHCIVEHRFFKDSYGAFPTMVRKHKGFVTVVYTDAGRFAGARGFPAQIELAKEIVLRDHQFNAAD